MQPALLAAPASPRALAGHVLLHDAHDQARVPRRDAGTRRHRSAQGLRFNQTSLAIDAAVAGQASRLRPIRWSSATSPRADCKPFDFAFPLSVGFYLVYPAERRDDDAIVVMREWMAAQVVSDRRP